MSHSSNSTRSRKGILACTHEVRPNRVRLVFDDLHSDSDTYPQTWRSGAFITRNEYDAEQFRSLNLTDEQLREIGQNLVAFLVHRQDLEPFSNS